MPPANNQNNGYPPQPGQPYGPPNGQQPAPGQPQLVYGQPQMPQPVAPAPQATAPNGPPAPAPAYPAQPQVHKDGTPYDFFLDPKKKPQKKSALPGANLGTLPKIIIIAAAAIVLFIIIAIVISASKGKSDTAVGLPGIVDTQQEIIRVSALGETKTEGAAMQNLAITANTTTQSDQNALIAYITKFGGKINVKALATAADPQNDRLLAAAEASSTYDSGFNSVMQQLLSDYATKLQTSYKTATGSNEKTILKKDYADVQLLQKMLSQ